MRGDEFFAEAMKQPPFTKLDPRAAAFFMDYMSNEKVVRFGDCYVANTNFPPFPSRAFDNLADHLAAIGRAEQALVSVVACSGASVER